MGVADILKLYGGKARRAYFFKGALHGKFLALQRISGSGALLEFAANEVVDPASEDFPVRLDQKGTEYPIYYRAGK